MDDFRLEELLKPFRYDTWDDEFADVDLAEQSGDYDDDGADNLIEYALDGNPTNPADIGIVPIYGTSGNVFEYIYPRRKASNSGLTYYLELTDNLVLGGWTNTGYAETGAGNIDAVFESVTNEIPTTGKTNEFIRLRIISE